MSEARIPDVLHKRILTCLRENPGKQMTRNNLLKNLMGVKPSDASNFSIMLSRYLLVMWKDYGWIRIDRPIHGGNGTGPGFLSREALDLSDDDLLKHPDTRIVLTHRGELALANTIRNEMVKAVNARIKKEEAADKKHDQARLEKDAEREREKKPVEHHITNINITAPRRVATIARLSWR